MSGTRVIVSERVELEESATICICSKQRHKGHTGLTVLFGHASADSENGHVPVVSPT